MFHNACVAEAAVSISAAADIDLNELARKLKERCAEEIGATAVDAKGCDLHLRWSNKGLMIFLIAGFGNPVMTKLQEYLRVCLQRGHYESNTDMLQGLRSSRTYKIDEGYTGEFLKKLAENLCVEKPVAGATRSP